MYKKKSPLLFTILPFFFVFNTFAGTMIVGKNHINMTPVKVKDYEAGYKEELKANRIIVLNITDPAWKLFIKTNSNNMGINGTYTKPITDFEWRASGDYATQTTYIPITNYDVEAASGETGKKFTIYIDHKVLLLWSDDIPGDYNIDVTYTVTTE
ncbi:hypothetical protein ACFL4O_00810 [bacterium]